MIAARRADPILGMIPLASVAASREKALAAIDLPALLDASR